MHALLDVTSLSYDSIQDKYSALLLMDFRKAFDTVSHNILLQKLYHYGVRGPANLLIESYLTERKQYVSINNCASSTNSVRIGVPQGSILGPLFYLIYVNDLCNATKCNPRLFADDTCLVVVWRGISSKTYGRTKAEGFSFYHPGHQTSWVRC